MKSKSYTVSIDKQFWSKVKKVANLGFNLCIIIMSLISSTFVIMKIGSEPGQAWFITT